MFFHWWPILTMCHFRKQVSQRLIEEQWGSTLSPTVKPEIDAEGKISRDEIAVIRSTWTALYRMLFTPPSYFPDLIYWYRRM
jgi:hypothetical protein